MDFQEADRRYAELKRQLDIGMINVERFNTALKELMVQDTQGRWWARSPATGQWSYHDGANWIPATPPGAPQPIWTGPDTMASPGPAQTDNRGGLAIASLVVGIIAMIAWLLPICGLPVSITSMVLGYMGRQSDQRTLAIIGLVLSSISLGLSLLNAFLGAMMALSNY